MSHFNNICEGSGALFYRTTNETIRTRRFRRVKIGYDLLDHHGSYRYTSNFRLVLEVKAGRATEVMKVRAVRKTRFHSVEDTICKSPKGASTMFLGCEILNFTGRSKFGWFKNLLQLLLACVNMVLEKKMPISNRSSTSSRKPWRLMRLGLILWMRSICITITT